MRRLVPRVRYIVILLVALLAGCVSEEDATDEGPADAAQECEPTTRTFWFDDGFLLREGVVPTEGAVFSNGFNEAFLTDDMDVWLSEPFAKAMLIQGDITLEFWAHNHGTPAPVVIGGQPGEGYHWFNQLGTDKTFVTDYGRAYSDVVPESGSVDHYNQTIAVPEGGLVVETGDRLRVLLTSLVLDDDYRRGQAILYGGDTPSQIRFTSTCWQQPGWDHTASSEHSVDIVGHQGLITGAIPDQEGVNFAQQTFTLKADTDRLTIWLDQQDDINPNKDDMDMTIFDAAGNPVWSIGSPYADEAGRLWRVNLDAFMPPGDYTVRVDSYSGHGYSGTLNILQEIAVDPGTKVDLNIGVQEP